MTLRQKLKRTHVVRPVAVASSGLHNGSSLVACRKTDGAMMGVTQGWANVHECSLPGDHVDLLTSISKAMSGTSPDTPR